MASEVSFTGQSGSKWRYWTNRPLGTPGGFGGVYAAEAADGTPMAVKVVKKERPWGMLDDRLLYREVEIGRRVNDSVSDMLLPVIDAADKDDALLLVMVRAGESLSAALPMSESDAIAAMIDIATGLQQLHTIGIIHRDLKPANVLRDHEVWKLADFGIARDQEIGTQDPTFVGWGSFPYMAPELWEARSPTVKTDLYALGCVGFELLAGRPPFIGDQTAIRAAHLTQAPPDVPSSNATLQNLIKRLLAKNPGDRPQDARAVLDRLHRAATPRTPVQESIARGLGDHYAERSVAAAQAAAVSAERSERIAQANADLREILNDALEELQAIEPDADLNERSRNRRRGSGIRFSTDITLSAVEVSVDVEIWDDAPILRPVEGDTMLLAGSVHIANRRHRRRLNIANIVYEQVDDRYVWQIYTFRNNAMVPPDQYPYGPYGATHGLSPSDFLEERHNMLRSSTHVWINTVTPFTVNAVLDFFQKAVELAGPGSVEASG